MAPSANRVLNFKYQEEGVILCFQMEGREDSVEEWKVKGAVI